MRERDFVRFVFCVCVGGVLWTLALEFIGEGWNERKKVYNLVGLGGFAAGSIAR